MTLPANIANPASRKFGAPVQEQHEATLFVENVHCSSCIERIERALRAEPGVQRARVNLSTRRVVIAWIGASSLVEHFIARLGEMGFPAVRFEERDERSERQAERTLLRALAISGFAAGNVMLFSVSVWSGLWGEMGPATRALHYWLSAAISIPAVIYAGMPFYRSAWAAVRRGGMNMDLPISVGVILTCLVSLLETVRGGEHAYFDAAISLVFFLLAGRYLDERARGAARSEASHLLALRQKVANIVERGIVRAVPLAALAPGQRLLVAPGETLAADGVVNVGSSSLDVSSLNGEAAPERVVAGDKVYAGTVNLQSVLEVAITAVGEQTLLAEIIRLMEAAEQRRAAFVVMADRAARWYAPLVHILAAITLAGWWLAGGGWHAAMMNAIAVLIVTCPCALGLAVPVVQVVAAGRLFRSRILLKSATALERLAETDIVLLDKTGTATEGRLELAERAGIPADALQLAARMAAASRHPLAQAIYRAGGAVAPLEGVSEHAGCGLSAGIDGGEVRLGRKDWAFAAGSSAPAPLADDALPEVWLCRPDAAPVRFAFEDRARADAQETVALLKGLGYEVELLSGDREEAVSQAASHLGIARWRAACRPDEKVAHIKSLVAAGRRPLMIGDGINDAPALAAAHASMSPASGANVSQNAADAVFLGGRLMAVAEAVLTARRTQSLVYQNFALAIAYNAIAVPLAMAGQMTPLVASIAMSLSSVSVVANALRLRMGRIA